MTNTVIFSSSTDSSKYHFAADTTAIYIRFTRFTIRPSALDFDIVPQDIHKMEPNPLADRERALENQWIREKEYVHDAKKHIPPQRN